jgi:hypothetical protein
LLRRIALPLAEQAPHGAALGFCWPSVLELLLRHTPPDTAGRLLDTAEAYLLEADPPATWQIFAQASFSSTLAKLGFAASVTPPEPATESIGLYATSVPGMR